MTATQKKEREAAQEELDNKISLYCLDIFLLRVMKSLPDLKDDLKKDINSLISYIEHPGLFTSELNLKTLKEKLDRIVGVENKAVFERAYGMEQTRLRGGGLDAIATVSKTGNLGALAPLANETDTRISNSIGRMIDTFQAEKKNHKKDSPKLGLLNTAISGLTELRNGEAFAPLPFPPVQFQQKRIKAVDQVLDTYATGIQSENKKQQKQSPFFESVKNFWKGAKNTFFSILSRPSKIFSSPDGHLSTHFSSEKAAKIFRKHLSKLEKEVSHPHPRKST